MNITTRKVHTNKDVVEIWIGFINGRSTVL